MKKAKSIPEDAETIETYTFKNNKHDENPITVRIDPLYKPVTREEYANYYENHYQDIDEKLEKVFAQTMYRKEENKNCTPVIHIFKANDSEFLLMFEDKKRIFYIPFSSIPYSHY